MGTWIPEDHLQRFLTLLAKIVSYPINDGDRDAIRFGIRDTDEEQNRWYDYPLFGTPPVYLGFACAGRERLALRWQMQEPVGQRIEALALILQHYQPDGEMKELEGLCGRAFIGITYPAGTSLLSCDAAHLAICPECQEVRAIFEGKHWSELVSGSNRPPRYYASLSLLRPEAYPLFYPAYIMAALRDQDREWLDIARQAGLTEEGLTVLQRELLRFADHLLGD
jgi:hypothetical protein